MGGLCQRIFGRTGPLCQCANVGLSFAFNVFLRIRLASQQGDIICEGTIEGDVIAETQGEGDFKARLE